MKIERRGDSIPRNANHCLRRGSDRADRTKAELAIVGDSAGLASALAFVRSVAPTDATVLLTGETGTGKELIARAIYQLSARRDRPLVKASCGSIPAGLLENELFGHEKGAFTGAWSREIGRFELADTGTLFLDEVGDIPLELQAKLLRVLQEREYERLGSSRTLRTDVRVVAATNRDLGLMVASHQFRSDLYYRLNIFPIHLPPLRERREDIPQLVWHFVRHYGKRMNKTIDDIPAEVMEAMTRYAWPGNVRELQNVLERAVILSTGRRLATPFKEMRALRGAPVAPEPFLAEPFVAQPFGAQPFIAEPWMTLEDVERGHIRNVLEDTEWVVGGPHGAAARLGLRRTTLLYKMRKLGIARSESQTGVSNPTRPPGWTA